MANFPPWAWIRKCISCKLITIIITERGGVCCSRNLNNLTACLRIYSIFHCKIVHFWGNFSWFSDKKDFFFNFSQKSFKSTYCYVKICWKYYRNTLFYLAFQKGNKFGVDFLQNIYFLGHSIFDEYSTMIFDSDF